MKVSIIVPFYNTEKYLERCLNSIVLQTFRDYEVILIDDGSTDRSYKIAEKYSSKYKNFKLYKQKNRGVACARNKGLLMAEGEYIAFVDSDDFIDKHYLRQMVCAALRTGADIICCNFYWVYHNKIPIKNYINYKIGLFSNMEALNMIIADTFMQSYLWNKLWKKDLFVNFNEKFPDMFFEDIATSFKMVYYSNKIYIMEDALYYYTQRSDSILHNFSFLTQADYLKSLMIIRNFLDTHALYSQTHKSYNFLCGKVILVMMISLFLIHFQQRTFGSLYCNYKSVLIFIINCHRNITNEEREKLNNLVRFQ